jgi:hypothetical protein
MDILYELSYVVWDGDGGGSRGGYCCGDGLLDVVDYGEEVVRW